MVTEVNELRLGNQLQTLREEQKMSPEEVAKQVGVSVQNIHKWENNQSYPEIQHLLKLGDIYGTTIDEFIKSDAALQNRINIREEEKADDDELLHPGFYIGIGIMFLGTFLSLIIGNLMIMMVTNIAGMLITCFYKDILKLLKDVKKDFYEQG
ncbi:helix-turn-helix domain-containing protein [Priestia megaterium]|uniref:helix-turn-helix domain-containing protein n=1 Tax=Priestia megaterium TaxID=1404 RepID=UPI002559C411|nr:helix-turn-helix transcriptional regulator [Priestia megaterium]MCM3183881.1 helix-turn-helix transcriptional regulator [Priestia megaterium]MED3866085.1 helix-turn-helix transcriptional regulator [Priestia megaterium]MED4101661.1 helix-turn-helix transcriptional regulator [Priestia megaterium]MED4145753.1 helix-turn-helix transcriptional regulator [Priestia megaterium]MED4166402.1 helix-turn-helix transcriptional regulator [Priestia megaterium]